MRISRLASTSSKWHKINQIVWPDNLIHNISHMDDLRAYNCEILFPWPLLKPNTVQLALYLQMAQIEYCIKWVIWSDAIHTIKIHIPFFNSKANFYFSSKFFYYTTKQQTNFVSFFTFHQNLRFWNFSKENNTSKSDVVEETKYEIRDSYLPWVNAFKYEVINSTWISPQLQITRNHFSAPCFGYFPVFSLPYLFQTTLNIFTFLFFSFNTETQLKNFYKPLSWPFHPPPPLHHFCVIMSF